MSIEVRGLVKRFGAATAVAGVGFRVERGEFVSLLGPSGCGKTTTLRCIAGLEAPDEGQIVLGGDTVTDTSTGVTTPPDRRAIGMVFQSYAIWPHMTVSGNVAFPLEMRKRPRDEIAERVAWALELVGMEDFARRKATELSGGQQQRVAVARAIVGSPRVLLFDEPLSNLDAKLRDRTRGELRSLQRRLDVATLYVTHDQAEALSLSDRVIVMDAGRIVQEATPKELYRKPRSPFVADFVGAANVLDVIVAPRDDGTLTARAPDGSSLLLPQSAAGSGVGRRARLVIRPEQMRLIVPETMTPEAGWNVLHGEVRQALFMGAHTEYTVNVGGIEIRVLSRDDVGEVKALIAFKPEDCVLIADGARAGDEEKES